MKALIQNISNNTVALFQYCLFKVLFSSCPRNKPCTGWKLSNLYKNYISIIKSTKTALLATVASAQVYFFLSFKLQNGEHVFLMMILKKPQCASCYWIRSRTSHQAVSWICFSIVIPTWSLCLKLPLKILLLTSS